MKLYRRLECCFQRINKKIIDNICPYCGKFMGEFNKYLNEFYKNFSKNFNNDISLIR